MNVAIFSARKFEREHLEKANGDKYFFKYFDATLSQKTAHLAEGCEAVSIFVSDDASAPVLQQLKRNGVKFLALRSAGYNNVDLEEMKKLNMKAARVPEYSPFAVAEHAVALMLALNRKLIQAHSRIRKHNFSLDDLTGFDMNGKTVGIMGTGKIGAVVAKIMHGFGCRILAYDIVQAEQLKKLYNVEYTTPEDLYAGSDIITLHLPLNTGTKYIINEASLDKMKKGVMLINTGRGKLIKTADVIKALKDQHIGYLGLDVYEKEEGLFFEDHSGKNITDDEFLQLTTFNNVLITGHQAFLTDTALQNIASATIYNLDCFASGTATGNSIA